MKSCLIIGSTVCDIIINLPSIPKSAQDTNIYGQSMQLGGCAYNVVSVLHQLSIPYTFLSPIGTGIYGRFVEDELQKMGIKTNVRSKKENGCCYCLVEDGGERTFLSYHGAEYSFQPSCTDKLELGSYAYIYACGIEVEDSDGDNIIDCLEKCTGEVIFSPGPRVRYIAKERLRRIFALKPILHVNQEELSELTNTHDIHAGVHKLFLMTGNIIIVTMGKDGSACYDGKEYFCVPAKKVEVVDTIGAGDSHIGAIIAGLSMEKNLKKALYFANDVASAVVAKKGAGLAAAEYIKIMHIHQYD